MSSSDSASNTDKLPSLTVKAGPRDPQWLARLAEEYQALIASVQANKDRGQDWFSIEALNEKGTKWAGVCWYYHDNVKYQFKMEFELPATYPSAIIEIKIPELDGLTAKMYRGGAICLDEHLARLWSRNIPAFGIVHALTMGLGPWLSVEIPDLISKGKIAKQ